MQNISAHTNLNQTLRREKVPVPAGLSLDSHTPTTILDDETRLPTPYCYERSGCCHDGNRLICWVCISGEFVHDVVMFIETIRTHSPIVWNLPISHARGLHFTFDLTTSHRPSKIFQEGEDLHRVFVQFCTS